MNQTTVPVFIRHTINNRLVSIQNNLLYVSALAAADVPFEYHIYPDGVYGLSLTTRETRSERSTHINLMCAGWLKDAIRYMTEYRISINKIKKKEFHYEAWYMRRPRNAPPSGVSGL